MCLCVRGRYTTHHTPHVYLFINITHHRTHTPNLSHFAQRPPGTNLRLYWYHVAERDRERLGEKETLVVKKNKLANRIAPISKKGLEFLSKPVSLYPFSLFTTCHAPSRVQNDPQTGKTGPISRPNLTHTLRSASPRGSCPSFAQFSATHLDFSAGKTPKTSDHHTREHFSPRKTHFHPRKSTENWPPRGSPEKVDREKRREKKTHKRKETSLWQDSLFQQPDED